MKKRVISIFLVLALALTLLPVSVLAAAPVSVTIGGITLTENSYLPSHGDSLTSIMPWDGFAALRGNVLTLCNFTWEGTVFEPEGGTSGLVSICGDVTVKLIGASNIISANYAAIRSDGELTVTGSGSLRLYGKLNGLIAENFTMKDGTLFASADFGGNGIAVTDNVTFRGGDLIVDADTAFYTFDYENYDDPVVTAAPGVGSTVTVRYGFRDEELLSAEFSTSGTVPVRGSNDLLYQRFWFTDGHAEAWPAVPSEPYDLVVAGVYVTEENRHDVLGDGTVRFDPVTDTLQLKQADLSYEGIVVHASQMDLTIEVLGECSLISTTENAIRLDVGDLAIRGGSLTVRGGLNGIFVYGDAMLTNCRVAVEGQDYGIQLPIGSLELQKADVVTVGKTNIGISVSTSSGSLILDRSILKNSGAADGIEGRNLMLQDSELETTGAADGAWLTGVLQIQGSKAAFVGQQNAVQIKGGAALMKDSIVNATSKGSDIAIYAERGLSIEGSAVLAEGRPAIAVISANGTLESDGGIAVGQILASNGTTQLWTFVNEAGDAVSSFEMDTREETGEVPDRGPDEGFDDVPDEEPDAPSVVPPMNLGALIAILSAAVPEFPFDDVASSDWFYDEVKDAWSNGLINGVTENTFMPESSLTVAQAIKLAAALHQMLCYGDVSLVNGSDYWYSTYVDYAISTGVIAEEYRNYSEQQMNAPVTRREFVAIFYNAMDAGSYYPWNTVADNAIPDVKLGDRNASQIYAFYRTGILTGSDAAGTFHPESTIKRSEAAAILIRMYDCNARQSITLG